MNELDEALEDFRAKFAFYEQKAARKYKTIGDNDFDVVQGAWNRYLKLRKQHLGNNR
jgi:hypothetical protein